MGVRFENNSSKVKEELENAVNEALYRIGLQAVKNTTGYITSKGIVDTGRLRASMSFITPEKSYGSGEGAISGTAPDNTVIVGTDVDYASYIELSTSKTPARPYLSPAIQNHIGEYKTIAETVLKG